MATASACQHHRCGAIEFGVESKMKFTRESVLPYRPHLIPMRGRSPQRGCRPSCRSPRSDRRSYRSVAHPRRGHRRTLFTVRLQRQVVDYALRRRSLLAEVYSGRTGVTEVCDANPYLLRAAKFHGKLSSVMCPICRKEQLTLVSWVFGDHLGAVSGSARSAEELILLTTRFDEFSVHVVEVCRTCSWNHLVKSYVLGAPRPAKGAPGTRTARRTGARTASE